MRFAAITLGVGVAGALLAGALQGGAAPSDDALAAVVQLDDTVTGGIQPSAAQPVEAASAGVRLIDLKSGASCRAAAPPETGESSAVPLGADCAGSPSLSRIASWRATANGSLIMADAGGRRVLEFAPGDGVMFESVYPPSELITIVPARG